MRRDIAQATDIGLVFVVLVWGFSPTLFKVVFTEMQPLAFVFLRFLVLSAFALLVLAVRGARGGRAWRIHRGDIAALVISGLSGYGLYQLFYMIGLAHTTVFASALLVATVPVWSVVFLALLRAERVHPTQWLGIAVSLAGVAWFLLAAPTRTAEVTLSHPLTAGDMVLGGVLSLGAAALFAVYGIVNKRLAPSYSPPELMCYTLCVGTLALAPFGIPALLSQNWHAVTWHTWVILPYSVLFPIYLTYSIWNWAIGVRGVGYVTLYSYAVPIMGGVIGFLLLHEALTSAQLAAGAIVLAGMLVARWGVMRAATTAQAAVTARMPGATKYAASRQQPGPLAPTPAPARGATPSAPAGPRPPSTVR